MQTMITQFKSIIQDIETTFHFPTGCSTEIAKAALLDCLKWIGQIEDQAKAQEEARKSSESQENPPTPTEEKPNE